MPCQSLCKARSLQFWSGFDHSRSRGHEGATLQKRDGYFNLAKVISVAAE